MKTEVSSDKPITKATLNSVVTTVETGLSRYMEQLTRAEIHLKKANGSGNEREVECVLEVRPAGREPVVVKDQAASLGDSVGGAVGKMRRLLESAFGRSKSLRGGPSASGQAT